MKIGSLFSGYGGLDIGVMAALGGSVAWHVEFDKAPSKILDHHWPDVPNYGDVTTVDWSQVEPVDVITGGSPCQDLSHAGKRAGMTEGTRSNLWVAMREAIAQLRPAMVVWENVRGAYSAAADSEVEPCPGCVGDGSGLSLRALGRVLGDLSDLGYDCRWHGLRASDIGAPHGRFRVFVVASARDAAGDHLWQHAELGGGREGGAQQQARGADRDSGTLLPTPAAYDGDRGGPQHPDKRKAGGHSVTLQDAVHGLLPTPRATRGGSNTETVGLLPTPRATGGTKGGPNQRGSSGDLMLPSAVTLLPTPAAKEPGGTLEQYHARLKAHDGRDSTFTPLSMAVQLLPTPTSMDSRSSGGNPSTTGTHGTTLTDATVRGVGMPSPLLQTPSVADGGGGHLTRSGERGEELLLPGQARAMHGQDWGIYADAIARWEALTRPAPAPTQRSKKGTPQLSPAFSEWMMGLPAGHVTGVPGLSRNDMLKALGNGVVPQQAEAALRRLLQ